MYFEYQECEKVVNMKSFIKPKYQARKLAYMAFRQEILPNIGKGLTIQVVDERIQQLVERV